MEVIVHSPENPLQQKELIRRVACVHAEVILNHIQKLSCPAQQKKELINCIKFNIKNEKISQDVKTVR